jgi:hypothetical protein
MSTLHGAGQRDQRGKDAPAELEQLAGASADP